MNATIHVSAVTPRELAKGVVYNLQVHPGTPNVSWSTWEKSYADFIEKHLGETLSVEYTEKGPTNGWTTRTIKSIEGCPKVQRQSATVDMSGVEKRLDRIIELLEQRVGAGFGGAPGTSGSPDAGKPAPTPSSPGSRTDSRETVRGDDSSVSAVLSQRPGDNRAGAGAELESGRVAGIPRVTPASDVEPAVGQPAPAPLGVAPSPFDEATWNLARLRKPQMSPNIRASWLRGKMKEVGLIEFPVPGSAQYVALHEAVTAG